ncbi:MAG: glycoside hydrolase family 43 protein [Janthinobacterium lividum]
MRFISCYPARLLVPLLLLGFPNLGAAPPAPPATFTNPLLASGPDPWVIQQGGFYYFMATTGPNITIRKTAKMAELRAAPAHVVWAPGAADAAHATNIWAPELHYLDGKWYIYYTAGPRGQACCGGQRSWVLENASPDPLASTWTDKGQLASPTEDYWAIDGTVFELRGQRYYLWSGQPTPTSTEQRIYISAMRNPWTLMGPRVMLTRPELNWELNGTPKVNEGPEILQHAGRVFLLYSAGHCSTDDYTLGQLTLTGSDPLDAQAWTKSPTPVFVKNPVNHTYGPGHNGFFTSKDGQESWIIYHANSRTNEGCGNPRNPRMQQFTWNLDGTPNFGIPVDIDFAIRRPGGE